MCVTGCGEVETAQHLFVIVKYCIIDNYVCNYKVLHNRQL
jgi:hypothetical protein